MCDRMIKIMFAGILAACILCGCTRREQLTLETGGAVQSTEETEDAEHGGSPEGDAADGNALAGMRQGTVEDGGSKTPVQSGTEASTICVHVCGAVKNPGVYQLAAGSRVFEAVREAGGFTAEADESYVNQAQQLTDGIKLTIPTVEQVENACQDGSMGQPGIVEGNNAGQPDGYGIQAGSSGTDQAESGPDGKININTASEAQLCEIPGIGATRAAAIVAYRQQSGGFASIEDIMNVSGIKEGTYEKIKDRITVN